MIRQTGAIGFALGLSLCGLLLGCGESARPVGTVSGVVTLDGEPIENVVVYFEPERGRTSSGITDENGRYELDYDADTKGAEVGRHTVRITRNDHLDEMTGLVTDGEAEKPKPVPEKYNLKSTLHAEVQAGSNTFDFELDLSER